MQQVNTNRNMIQEIKIKNFLSFKDETTLSFIAGKDTFGEETQVVEVEPGVRLLRFVALYGANASGKSNFLKVFEFLWLFWSDPFLKIGDKIKNITPFLFDQSTPKQPSEFEIVFYFKAVKYRYTLQVTQNEVVSEELYYYKNERQTTVFKRYLEGRLSKIEYGKEIKLSKIVKNELELKCLINMSLFSASLHLNIEIPILTETYWFLRSLFWKIEAFDISFNVSDDDTLMKDFLKDADFNISKFKNIGVGKEQQTLVGHSVKNNSGEEVYYLPSGNESDGTKTVVDVVQQLIDNCFETDDNGEDIHHCLSADELEKSLHPDLFEKILHFFLNLENNQNQLVIATHYSGLLETVNHLIRKDSVRFVDKKENGSSEIYSLADFKGLEKIDSIYKTYRKGCFGAVPNISY